MSVETIRWIACTDAMPDDEMTVLIWGSTRADGEVAVGFHEAENWFDASAWPAHGVTHWAEMPVGPASRVATAAAVLSERIDAALSSGKGEV